MILVVPAIALHEGRCYFLVKGEDGTEEIYQKYSDYPNELCRLWRSENARVLHITDFDSFFDENAMDNLNPIFFLAKVVDIPVQVLSNFKSIEECKYLLDNGIYRIVIYGLALDNPDGVRALIKKYSDTRITFFMNVNNEEIDFWNHRPNISVADYIDYIKDLGGNRLYLKDSSKSEESGPNHATIERIAALWQRKITLFGSITSPEHLWDLAKLETHGVDSVVIGKPLYDNNFPCQKIWRTIEAELEPK